ncbi:MAG: ATP-binding cassette domain-containing protein [Chloroflexi bacterium]|nr:ATP-binding cassette domain-containing protein [Chloroflexota bacterium]
MTEQPLIAAEDVWFAYPNAGWVLRDVSLHIAGGEYVAIVGRNGAGKTTLAKLCNGLLLPTRGRVRVLGQDTASLRPRQLAGAVGYVFQNPDHQIFAATTREEIAFGPHNLGLSEADVRARTDDALARFGLQEVADTPPAMLGFALRRKVALAAVYAMRPRALILDEPTGGLDRDSVGEVMRAVAGLHAEGHSIILITHDMALVAGQAQRVVLLQEGQIVLDATPRETFAQGERLRAAGLVPPQITRLAQRLAPHGLPADLLTVEEFASAYELIRTRAEAAPGRRQGAI